MMQRQKKLFYFEFVLNRLLLWYEERFGNVENNDLSILKALKLLFFVTASRASWEKSLLLDHVFDHFVAMPYGHVESDIYNYLSHQHVNLQYYRIDNTQCKIKFPEYNQQDYDWTNLDQELLNEIEKSISVLRHKNDDLIKMSAFELVDLSHAWYSWSFYHTLGKKSGSNSMEIPPAVIKSEDKIFNLQLA